MFFIQVVDSQATQTTILESSDKQQNPIIRLQCVHWYSISV